MSLLIPSYNPFKFMVIFIFVIFMLLMIIVMIAYNVKRKPENLYKFTKISNIKTETTKCIPTPTPIPSSKMFY